ncbi:MAG: hypothetical protein ABIB79_04015 [archaeon]
MKKRILVFAMLIFCIIFISAEPCQPKISLINQDPYPAIPGEYVKIVFQVSNISNTECRSLSLELLEQYPLIFDPNAERVTTLDAGFYKRDYGSFLLAPYKVRIDGAALEGDNPIETIVKHGYQQNSFTNEFNIYIEDSRADFELHIDKYSYLTKELTIEILNVADVDVEALTLEIPRQDNIDISGTNRVVVGDLDSNEYTTADFKGDIKDGEIQIRVLYTDSIGERRELTKGIIYDSSYFADSAVQTGQVSVFYYILGVILVGLIIWYCFHRRRKRKERMRRRGGARLG